MRELYAPVKGPVRNDEDYLQGDVKTTVKSKEEIERMLQERWPGKIEPIKGPLRLPRATHKTKLWNTFLLPGSTPK